MDYGQGNAGGVGFEIQFPESLNREPIQGLVGRFSKANIERLELQGIIEGIQRLIEIYNLEGAALDSVGRIVVFTDRLGLSDQSKTNAFALRRWRKANWHNDEGKAIKNCDLLAKLDKERKKLMQRSHCRVEITYRPRRYNIVADGLASAAKELGPARQSLAVPGTKMGRRRFRGPPVELWRLKVGQRHVVHVYRKDPVGDQWHVYAEFAEGPLKGMKLTVYADSDVEHQVHRGNFYRVTLSGVFRHHVTLAPEVESVDAIA
jgi:ribonuclease HI